MDICKSDIVVSLAGRDRGQYFIVTDVDDAYIYVADGKGRKLEQPKRKSRKHIQFVLQNDSRVAEKIRNGDKVLNSELRRELAETAKKSTVITKGVN